MTTIATIDLNSIITNVAIKKTGELENFLYSLNSDGSEKENVNGSSKFYEITVAAFGRTFIVAAHEEHDGVRVVPSNGNLGAEAVDSSFRYLMPAERDDGIKACKGYFDLMTAIADECLGVSVDVEDYDDGEVPAEVADLHKALTEYLKTRM